MLQYCAHCRRRVVPDSEGNCPGCRKPDGLGDAAWIDQGEFPEVVLQGQAKFPPVCAFCGEPTEASRVLTWERKSPHARASGLGAMILGAGVGFLAGGLLGLFAGAVVLGAVAPMLLPQQVVSFRLPQCPACAGKRLDGAEVDWDNYRVHAHCHRNFRDALGRKS